MLSIVCLQRAFDSSSPEEWEETWTPEETSHKYKENTCNQNNTKISWHQQCCSLQYSLKFRHDRHVWCTEAMFIPTTCRQQVPLAIFETDQLTPYNKNHNSNTNQVCDCRWNHKHSCVIVAVTPQTQAAKWLQKRYFFLGYSCFGGKPIHAYMLLENVVI